MALTQCVSRDAEVMHGLQFATLLQSKAELATGFVARY